MYRNHYQQELPDLAPLINQSLLDPHLDNTSLIQSCDAAKHFQFAGLCTNLIRIPIARQRLGKSGKTKLIAVIAFPFGAIPSTLKQLEGEWAAAHGAEELEVVPNFMHLKENAIEPFGEELAKLCSIGLPIRVILDMNKLSSSNLHKAVEASIDAGVSGLQSGNGFGAPVSAKEIQLLADLAKGRCAIAASGGLHNLDQTFEIIKAGASRLGTSRGPELMQALRIRNKE